MGTNYYLETPACPHCGRGDRPLHIGKSSGGWCFGLHVIPEQGLSSLEDWRARWGAEGTTIRDEYGQEVTAAEMERVITQRSWPHVPGGDTLRSIVRGPNNLMRAPVDGVLCIGHGPGTWDLIAGDFS